MKQAHFFAIPIAGYGLDRRRRGEGRTGCRVRAGGNAGTRLLPESYIAVTKAIGPGGLTSRPARWQPLGLALAGAGQMLAGAGRVLAGGGNDADGGRRDQGRGSWSKPGRA
ncbi:MAG: hypothetical protein EA400_06755 [Chromatiaceae bacterium]|nr:MAG: hypothetical protein EA400_06755 [Chromatiaceae bacterium]